MFNTNRVLEEDETSPLIDEEEANGLQHAESHLTYVGIHRCTEQTPLCSEGLIGEYEAIKMSLRHQTSFLVLHLMKLRSIRFFFILSCTSFLLSLLWVEIVTRQKRVINESLIPEALENVSRDLRYSNVYRKTKYLPKNLKYILLWNHRDYAPFAYLEDGQRTFLKNNCSVINCYVTADKGLFGDYRKFHAIAFNGRTMKPYRLPRYRSPGQKYIYFNMESSDNYPACSPKFDGFFNLTATYKLDSDIPIPYVLIRDKDGAIIGPNNSMTWRKNMHTVKIDNQESVTNKTKIAAWFVSHCRSRSRRHVFVEQLQKALFPYGYEVDVFGSCGNLKCPTSVNKEGDDCNLLLKRDYFFYLALENSFSEDYVTEKLLTALNNNVVPIVFGGADYSRFLPPGSYIDGRNLHSYRLAAIMDRLIQSPDEYNRYFNWKEYYSYSDPSRVENMCKICEALNDDTLMKKTTVYDNFRLWWNSQDRC